MWLLGNTHLLPVGQTLEDGECVSNACLTDGSSFQLSEHD